MEHTTSDFPTVPGDRQIHFPLKGAWVAVNTPAYRIPSHGTDYLAQRFAIDFTRVNKTESPFDVFRSWLYLFARVAACRALAWGECVFSPVSGVVSLAKTDAPDRLNLSFAPDYLRSFVLPKLLPPPVWELLGNYVVIDAGGYFILLAHLRQWSVKVQSGSLVGVGEQIGEVGNSGNSMIPHLHIQAMSHVDVEQATAVAVKFEGLEVLEGCDWLLSKTGLPPRMQPVRGRP